MNNLNINQVVESGNLELFKLMINLDINLIDSIDDPYGRTPLIICAKFKKSESHFKIAQILLDSGSLMVACYYGNTRLVELLINSNSNLELQDIQSNTACQIAIEQSNSDCINLILNAMENKTLYELKLNLEKDLQDAVFNNDYNLLKTCLDRINENNLNLKQFINSTTSGNHTLLYRACRNTNPDIVKLLLDSNAIAKPHYYTKYSPLYIACHMGNFHVAKLILEKFPHLIQIETIEKFLPFHAVCSQGHIEILKLLINFNLTPIKSSLLKTYSKYYVNKLDQLYKIGDDKTYISSFDLNSLDVNDQTGLYHAVLTNQYEICNYLLNVKVKNLNKTKIEKFEAKRKKLEINLFKNLSNNTSNGSSIISSKSSNDSFLDQLKSVFLDSRSYDPYVINYTANNEQIGTENRKEDDLSSNEDDEDDELDSSDETLYFNPININQYSKFGSTCLHEAIKNKNLKLVELLIQHGANSNLPILDSSQNQISNSIIEALKSQDERLFYLVLKNFNCNENDFKMILNLCFKLDSYGFKMLPYLLKFKIINDSEHKISLYKRINDFGLILNWSSLDLTKVYESWLLNACLNYKISIITNISSFNIKKFHLQSITRIDLSNNNLESIPLSIFQIESLKLLKLSTNKIKRLPNEKNIELDDISYKSHNLNWACSLLEDLELDHNELVDLPTELFSLKSLKHLNVSYNQLEKLPVEMWQAPSLFDLNASFNNLTNLPLLGQACCAPRSRKEQKRIAVKEHPLKSPVEEKQPPFYALKNSESSELNYKLRPIDKANFWNKNSQILAGETDLNDQEYDLEEDKFLKYSKSNKNSISNESKLIELNLSNNKFKKIPESLSCLTPKLFKLNLSSNQIESMGAVCDLPSTLKFLDLSNNLITRSIRLLNKTYFKFILMYLNQIQPAKNETEIKKFENLLLENDFCYYNLVQKFLNLTKTTAPTTLNPASVLPNPHEFARSRQNRDREQSIQAHLRSNSNRRRTRSQSRNPNRNSASSIMLPASPGQNNLEPANKRLLPFDLFLINLKYNRLYSSNPNETYATEDYVDLEEDENLIKKEKSLINSQNIQIFLEQICPHKRHIKLESLKSLNLSQNKLKKLKFMFDLNVMSSNRNDSDSSGNSSLDESNENKNDDSNKNFILKSPLKKKPPLSPGLPTSPIKKNKVFLNKNEEKANMIAKLIFPNLTHLDISSNSIKQLPGSLSYLENLSYLNASSNSNLIRISPKLGLLTKLWNLDLKLCSNIKDPTLDSLIKQKTKTSDILGYLKSILDNSRPYNRVKLMFVGVQAIGKTTLLNKLREEGSSWVSRPNISQSSLSTVGVDINEWIYEKPKQKVSNENLFFNLYQFENSNHSFGPIIFRTWDFAGQREYYTTHQYFISKRALYLVCWKLSEEEKGINEIHHWLSNIQTRAPGSPCIIVGTHQDQLAKLKNYKEISNYLQRLIYEKFVRSNSESETTSAAYPPIFASIEISSKTGHNIKSLARLIYDVASQMKVPGMKDQLLLEQKIPCTYLALEECINFVLQKLKTQSRNPVLNTQDYLKEIRFAINLLYPDQDGANNEENSETAEENFRINEIIKYPINKTLMQNLNKKSNRNAKNAKISIRFRDDAEILQATQFLHDNGILIHYNDVALNDLYFLDPQWLCDILSTVVTIREINPFAAKGIMKIKDLLVLFKGSKRFSSECDEIMSYIVDLLGKFELALTWDNEHLLIPSLLPSEPMLKYSNQDIRISIISKQKLNSIVNVNNLVQSASCISSFNQEQQKNEITSQLYSNVKLVNSYSQMTLTNKLNLEFLYECKPDSETDSIRRLYSLTYLPSGFFSRLIVRILCDSILKECLLDLIDIEQSDNLDQKLIEFLSQEAEWKCWQTGIELKYLDYTLIRVKEVIQDPLVDLNSPSLNKQNDLFMENSVVFKDCENELKIKTINKQFCSFVECYASFSSYKICKCKKSSTETEIEKNQAENNNDDFLININLNKQISIKIFALIIEIIDSLLEDWYPDLGTRFMQDSKGDYLVTRLAPCDDCIKLIKQKDSVTFSNEIDDEEKQKLLQFENINWIYCFMLDDICYSVLKSSKLTCPKHGEQIAHQIAPDLAFEDIEKKFIIKQDNLKIEKLIGRGSFGSVFFGSLSINTNQLIRVAVKVLESINNNGNNLKEPEPIENRNLSKKSNSSIYWNYRKSIRLAAKAYSIARQEIAIISSLKHENIVSMIGLCIKPLSIILELAPYGNLKDILITYKKTSCKLSPFVIQQVCAQTSAALVYLHSNRIIYRDLKADNVLVWKFPTPNQINSSLSVLIKLADYSISRCVLPTGTKGFAGTPGFMAPEILKYNGEETYSEKVDCFSFAMLLYELLTLKHPFEGQEQIKDIILNGGRPIIKSQDLIYPTLMLDLMCLCWADNPAERPSSTQLSKYTQSYEFSHLIDVTILEDYDQAPLIVTCINQENDDDFEENDRNENSDPNTYNKDIEMNQVEEDEEIEEEDLIDIWVIKNSNNDESAVTSQLEVLTYENKLNCTNRKLINVSNFPVESICYLNKTNQIWLIDANKSLFIYCCKTYKKINQFALDINVENSGKIISINPIEQINQIILCTSKGLIMFIFLSEKSNEEFKYYIHDLSIKCNTTLILPSRFDNKSYDLWIGSDNSEIFCFSLKTLKLTGSYLHSSSHHYLTNSLLNTPTSPKNNPVFTFTLNSEQPQTPESPKDINVTILKTTNVDTFFLWSYIYPGSTIYLWNHVSKKIMSAYNCRKAFDELNYDKSNLAINRDFRIIDIEFLNSHLYCGINNGIVLVLKRLTLTPLHMFSSHMHQLHNLCSLTFETRLLTFNRLKKQNVTTQVKKTQNMLLTIGRALAPIHEDIYLTNGKYRIDALRKYANCLILNAWNCNND